jgi:hypothetical protein
MEHTGRLETGQDEVDARARLERRSTQGLAECNERWPEHEFRGHHVLNQRPGSDKLRAVE